MASNVGNIKVKLNLDSAAYEYGIKQATNSIKSLSAAFGALGLGATVMQVGNLVNKLKEQQQAERAVSSVIRSTGEAAGVTSQELSQMARELQNVSNYGDEAILQGQKLLLTFTNIKGSIFRDATKAMLDMSAVMGQDLSQTATMLGKALQDPIKGVTALRRVGVMLSDTQKEQIKNFMAVGDVAKAQQIILKELETEFGNAAKNLIEPTDQFKNKLSDVQEELGGLFKPAVDEAAKSGIKLSDAIIEDIHSISEWLAVNKQFIGGVKDAAIALAVLAAGIPLTNTAVVALMTSMRSFGVITAKTTAYQVAFATLLKGDASLAMLQFRTAIQATIIQIRGLTLALLQCPLTWITLILGVGAAAWWNYQNSLKDTQRAIESVNNAQTEQVNKTNEAIRTLKELDNAKNLDYTQTKRLEAAIEYLTEKYPNYIGKLREELRLKGEISRATAEQIANEMTLAKVKELEKQRQKVEKIISNRNNYALYETTDGATHFAYEDEKTKEFNRINKEIYSAVKEREAIIKELTELEKKEASPYTYSSGGSSGSKSAASKLKDEKQKQKEALDLKIAMLEQEKYLTERTEEEIYQIELKQAEARLAAAKKGTAEYAQALAQKLKLEQEHSKRVRDLQLENTVAQNDADREKITNQISWLSIYQSAYQINKKEQLEQEIALLQQQIQLEKDSLDKQLQLMGRNEAEKVKLRRDSVKVQEQLTQELTRKNIELKNYEFEKTKSFIDGITSGFSSSISSMIKGEKSFADACYDILGAITDSFINEVTKMTAEWIMQKLRQIAFNNLFAASTTTTNAIITASNASTAAATSASAAATTSATTAMAGGVTALVSPVATLSATMGMLALSSSAVAANMAIIAVSTGLFSIEAILANISAMLLNTSLGLLAITSKLAAKGMASLAIANAANSAAQIPFVGWMIAPGAAASTAAAILASDSLVQFRENGGPVEAGKPYIVGEKRPELFIPDRNGRILPDTSALSGGGDTINQYAISTPMTVVATDAKSFASRIDEFTDRIHHNLEKKIKMRNLAPLS